MPTQYHLGRFSPDNVDPAALVPHIGRAHAALARYDGLLAAIPNARLLFAPLAVQEAVLSSQSEATQVTMGEVLEAAAAALPKRARPHRDSYTSTQGAPPGEDDFEV